MKVIHLRIFYALTFLLVLEKVPRILKRNLSEGYFQNFASFLNQVSHPEFFIYGIIVGVLLCAAFCIWKPKPFAQAATAFLFLMFIFAVNSNGKINKIYHTWMMILFCLPFFWKQHRFVLDLVQTLILLPYFASGLWKIRNMFEWQSLGDMPEVIYQYIAYSIAEGNGPPAFLIPHLESLKVFLVTGYVCAILFQVTSIVPIFKKELRMYWGIFAVLFHLSVGISMGIWFTEMMIAAGCFLVLFPERKLV